MIDKKVILNFLEKQRIATNKQIARLNDAKFIKKRSLRSKINYLKSFEVEIKQDEKGNTTYIYRDVHYFDTVRKVFLQFAKDKGLPQQAGFAIGRKKAQQGVTNVLDVFITDRRRVFRQLDNFIDKELIKMYLSEIEKSFQNAKKTE